MRIPVLTLLVLCACSGETTSEFFWRRTADKRAGPPELPYRGIHVDSLPSRIVIESDSIGLAASVRLVGSRLVVQDPMSDALLKVVASESGALQGSFAWRGQGPGEFQYPPEVVGGSGPFGARDKDKNDRFWLLDESGSIGRGGGNGTMTTTSRLLLADLQALNVLDSVSIDVEGRLRDAVWLSDSTLLGAANDSANALLLFSANGKLVQRVPADTTGWGRVPRDRIQAARIDHMCTDSRKSRAAIAYRWTDRVEIFTLNGMQSSRAKTPHGYGVWVDANPFTRQPMFSQDSPNARPSYWDCTANDELIYALFSGRLRKDFRRSGHECWYVHVFSWAGDLVRVIRLDHGTASIALNANGTVLYSADVTSARPSIRATALAK